MIKKHAHTLCTVTGLAGMAALVLIQATPATAQDQASGTTTINVQQNVVQVTGHMGLGYLDGEGKEAVFDNGHKLSELTWQLEDVYMMNLGGSIAPRPWLAFNADVWFKVTEGDGAMDDYDWMVQGLHYTDWSHHDDTDLTEGIMFDLNVAYTFGQFQETTFQGIVGYKHDTWEWEAKGGSYTYSTNYLYDTVGAFPDGLKAITYSQTYDTPYIGVGFHSQLTNLSLFGRFVYSPFAMLESEDTHHMRNLRIDGDFDPTDLFLVNLGFGYNLTPNLSLLGGVQYQKYDRGDGDYVYTDLTTNTSYSFPGVSASADHESYLFSITGKYSF